MSGELSSEPYELWNLDSGNLVTEFEEFLDAQEAFERIVEANTGYKFMIVQHIGDDDVVLMEN